MWPSPPLPLVKDKLLFCTRTMLTEWYNLMHMSQPEASEQCMKRKLTPISPYPFNYDTSPVKYMKWAQDQVSKNSIAPY